MSMAQFDEPGGVAFLDGKLYVADVNNQAVRVIDIAQDSVSTLELSNLEKLSHESRSGFAARTVQLDAVKLSPGDGTIAVAIRLPDGCKLAEDAPSTIRLESTDDKVIHTSQSGDLSLSEIDKPYEIAVTAAAGKTEIHIDAVVYYCEADSKLCLFDHVKALLPITVGSEGSMNVSVPVRVGISEGI